MNFQQLEYVIAVDRHKHFARAAKACHITQATLSAMIKKLEQELGLVLFDRSKHPIKTTEAGQEILYRSEKGELELVVSQVRLYRTNRPLENGQVVPCGRWWLECGEGDNVRVAVGNRPAEER